MKKPSIPAPGAADSRIADLVRPIKQNLDIITGRIGGEIVTLSSTATLADCISKINEIARRLNAST